jgi:hypothetical protein
MDVVFTHLTDVSALTMNIVDIEIVLPHIRSPRVIDQKSVPFAFKELVKFPQFRNSIEEDD